MSITIRNARMDDVTAIVPFIKMASGGISELLLEDMIAGVSADELIEMALLDETAPFYYHNVIVAESDGTLIAAVNFYEAEKHCLPDIMKALISKDKLDLVKAYLQNHIENSMYIHTLAVDSAYRYSSVGLDLCKRVERHAKRKNKRCVSAHVFQANTLVFNGLMCAGFKVVERIPIPKDPKLYYQSDMLLMCGPDI